MMMALFAVLQQYLGLFAQDQCTHYLCQCLEHVDLGPSPWPFELAIINSQVSPILSRNQQRYHQGREIAHPAHEFPYHGASRSGVGNHGLAGQQRRKPRRELGRIGRDARQGYGIQSRNILALPGMHH